MWPLQKKGIFETGRVLFLPVDAIHPNPYQPRRTFTQPELEELGRKAKFSQHKLTEEERAAAWRCAAHAAEAWRNGLRLGRKKKGG